MRPWPQGGVNISLVAVANEDSVMYVWSTPPTGRQGESTPGCAAEPQRVLAEWQKGRTVLPALFLVWQNLIDMRQKNFEDRFEFLSAMRILSDLDISKILAFTPNQMRWQYLSHFA